MTQTPGTTQTTPSAPFSLRHGMAAFGAGLLVASAMLVFLSISVLLPPVANDLGVGMGAVMVFVTINFLLGAISMAVLSPVLNRVLGTRMLIILGGLFTGASLFAVAYVKGLALLYVLAALSGVVFLASTQMAATLVIDNWFHAKRGLALGVMQGMGGLGGIAAGSLLPQVVKAGGWQLGFQVSGAIIGAIALLSGLVLVRTRPADVGLLPYGLVGPHHESALEDDADAIEAVVQHGVPFSQASRSPKFIALVAAIFLYNISNAIQQNLAPLMQGNGLSLTAAGSLISVLAITTAVGTLLLGTLFDKWGALRTSLLMIAMFLVALGVFLTTTGYAGQLVAVLLFAVPSVLAPIGAPIIVRQVFGGRAFTELLGIALAGMPLGIAIGSPLWGLAYDMTGGYDVAIIGAAALLVIIALLFVYTLRGHERPQH